MIVGQHVEPERLLVQIRPRGFSAGAKALAVFIFWRQNDER